MATSVFLKQTFAIMSVPCNVSLQSGRTRFRWSGAISRAVFELVDPEHHGIPVPVWGRGKGSTLGDVRHGALRPIVAESRIVGFWELDPDAEEVVTGLFAEVADATRDRVAEEAVALGTFLVKELGHGRSFSIDTEKHLRKRCEHIRNLKRS